MNKSSPKVSVVCAWYNRAQYITKSINSLLNQDYENFEVIIINDGSTDEKVTKILNSIVAENLKIIHQSNQGFTQTIKNAIAHCDGEFIAIHGAGDISAVDRLSKLITPFMLDESVVAVGSGTVQYPASYPFRRRYFKPDPVCNSIQLKKNMPFVHGSVMYRKDAYEKVNGYDTRFKYCADWDLFFKLTEQGKIISVNEFLYEQLIFSDGFSFSPEHKFKQIWFRDKATERSIENRKQLDESEKYLAAINPEDPSYIGYSFNFLIKSLYKFDFRNSFGWGKLLLVQLKGYLKQSLKF